MHIRFAVVLATLVLAAGVTAPAQTFTVPVEYFKLDNGLKVVVSTDRSAPVVLVEVIYNIGFRVEPKGRTGFAHLFEHMMFQGSANVKKMEHVSLMQEAGGVVNGSTRFDYTNYFQALPSNGLERALFLEADRMRSLDVTAENLKNQQNVVSEEVRVNVLNQPHGAFDWIEIWERANTNWHNAHDFYGKLDELEAATIEDVRAFFKTYYAPNNAVLVVAGDATAADVRQLAEKHFGSIPSQPQPAPADLSEPPQTAPKSFTRSDKLARTPAVAVAWHLPPRMTKDFFALSVLDPLLNSDDSARMYRKLVRDDRLAMSSSGRLQLPRPELGHEGADAVHDARRLFQRQDRRPGHCGDRKRARRGPQEWHQRGGTGAGQDDDAIRLPRRHGGRRHAAVRPRQSAWRVCAL